MNLAKLLRVPVSPNACGWQGSMGENTNDKIPPILKLALKSGGTQQTQACTDEYDADLSLVTLVEV